MSATPRLQLPFLFVGQAQKEFTHNEALQTLDLVVACTVQGPPQSDPPSAPQLGTCYIVGTAAAAAWAGRDRCIAGWSTGGWRFIAPQEGMSAYEAVSGISYLFRAGEWEAGIVRAGSLEIGGQKVVGARAPAIANPTGGGTVDIEARVALEALLATLREHGLIEA